MKKTLLFLTAMSCIILSGTSCKSKSSAYKSAYEEAKANTSRYEATEEEDYEDEEEEVATTETVSYESFRPEKLKPAYGEEAAGLKRYSVVIGSFKNRTNAYSLKERMIEEGYRPVVAENENGMLRVIVTSFDSKADATRSRDSIKQKYRPNFQDAWLLERTY
jgi:cell division protein FtsN